MVRRVRVPEVLFSCSLWLLPCIIAAQEITTQGDANSTNSTPNCTENFTAWNDTNYTGLPPCPEAPEPPCYTDKCWGTVAREARNSCMELSNWGADASRCLFFQDSASQVCNATCQDCAQIASAMYDECLFTLLAATVNYDDAIPTCEGLAEDFNRLRCPTALIEITSTCYGADNDACQAECGNWHKCDCWKLRGLPGEPDRCEGETELLRWDGIPDNCDQMPRSCFNHRPGTYCSTYRHCPANLCIIQDKQCPLTDSCQAVGVCAPSDGQCYYSTLPDGTPCDDGLFYTHTDVCIGAVCQGIEDKCIRHGVTCQTLNNCLFPTDKVRNSCDPSTGSCVFEAKPDGTACSSQPGGLIDGTCDAGLCRRTVLNRCVGKICASKDFCSGEAACDPWTGDCIFTPKPEGEECDDGNPNTYRDRCVEGQCIGDVVAEPLYAWVGWERCDGESGIDPNVGRYFGNTLSEDECKEQCSQDALCQAYAYGYYVCYIYGGQRTMDPSEDYWGKKWMRLEPAAMPVINHGISCHRKQDSQEDRPFFDEKAAWFFITVLIVVVLPAMWGLVMVWRPLSRSFRSLTGCCGGAPEDEEFEEAVKEGGPMRQTRKDQLKRSGSQLSALSEGNSDSKVLASGEVYWPEDDLPSETSSRMSVDALADHPSAVPSDDLEQVKLHKAAAAEGPRSPNDPRGQVQELGQQGSAEDLSTEASKTSKDEAGEAKAA
ncbi:unnamed protein product [Symbiodinium pilosum]|uniref:Apple domain-containing protein n=1 Tax=Symbiodinium pilosum TaxID=2952 RepID=A0A812VHT6_SYMPI|nr:unnamed protein product [Symbiodinium pilosum]